MSNPVRQICQKAINLWRNMRFSDFTFSINDSTKLITFPSLYILAEVSHSLLNIYFHLAHIKQRSPKANMIVAEEFSWYYHGFYQQGVLRYNRITHN